MPLNLKTLVFSIYLAASLLTVKTSRSQVITQDSLALVDLFNSTNGVNWTIKTNWLAGPVGKWFGVVISSNRVVEIDLSQNNLSGSIPSSLGNIDKLRSLDLEYNELTGSIPASLGNLADLQYLSLIINHLSGPVPSELGNLSKLVWLRLGDNELSGSLPSSLGSLSNLRYMHMGGCRFTGSIPTSFGNLSSMIEILLHRNQLSGNIPNELGNLSHMETFIVDINNLTGSIPASIGNLPALKNFTVFQNQLSGPIPATFANPSFMNLYLHNNRFTFAGMEMVAQKNIWQKYYAPQATIPLHFSCNTLWVSAGGTPSNNTYRWYNGNGVLLATKTTDSTFIPPSPGKYNVVVTNKIATALTLFSDTIDTRGRVQNISQTLCPGQLYILPSGKKVTASGTYYDTLRTVSGCTDSLITILTLQINTPQLISKDEVICEGQVYQLPSGKSISIEGTFTDTLHSAGGCDSLITILKLSITKPLRVTSEVTLCNGQAYRLPSGKSVVLPNVYYDTLRTLSQGCDSILTTLTVHNDPSLSEQQSTEALCSTASSVVLNAGIPTNSYAWNTGAVSNSITVNTPGIYSAIATGANGCIAHDTFHVVLADALKLSLDKNIIICKGQAAIIDAGAGYQKYTWNNGSNGQSINITTTGAYWVNVTDKYGCIGADTTYVTKTATPAANFLPPDTTACLYSGIIIWPAGRFLHYQWNNYATTATIQVDKPGIYSLAVIDSNGCRGTDDILVREKSCNEEVLVPNTFTPNNDGRNDLFRPVIPNTGNVIKFRLTIYNRWGERIFETGDPAGGWNGNARGAQQMAGVYVWLLTYQYAGAPAMTKKGTVVIIR